MKFKSKNGRVHNDRIAMTLANVRHRFTKKTEDDFMDYEEFADDYDESLDEESDEPGPECDNNNDGTDDSDYIDNDESTTNDEIESTITRVDDDCFLVSSYPKQFVHDHEPMYTPWRVKPIEETQVSSESNGYLSVEGDKNLKDVTYPAGNETMPKGDGEPLVTGWTLNMTDEYIEDFQKRADDIMHKDRDKMYDNMIPIPATNVLTAVTDMKNAIKELNDSTDILDEEIDESEPEQL